MTDENAIPFFFKYAKQNPQKRVQIKTDYGNFVIELSEKTPYHRANFIYLTKANYFDGTFFHRVVPDFIIQGGNSDQKNTSNKRRRIGKYLLPPDTKNGLRHHRSAVSMPSSEIENPHRLASPYEFFIVQQTPGAYHLDGKYTVFGYVVEGMEIVDRINRVPGERIRAKLYVEVLNNSFCHAIRPTTCFSFFTKNNLASRQLKRLDLSFDLIDDFCSIRNHMVVVKSYLE